MSDRVAELARLQQLRAQGALSEEEFAREKARVIGKARRGVGVAIGGGAVLAVAALGWALWPAGEATRPAPIASPSASPIAPADPLAGTPRSERARLADRAVFPQGRTYTNPDGVRITYEPGSLVEAPFGPVLVSEGRVPDGSHADSGHVAIHYLAPQGRGYRVVQAYPDTVQAGSFGQMSELAVSRRFGALPVVYAQGGGTWQGFTCDWTSLVELRPSGPVGIVSFMDAFDDSGAAVDRAASTSQGKIVDIVPDRSFAVRFTGTRAFTAIYRRQGDRYVLEGGDKNALTGC